jgi:hypothetical protein
MGVTCSANGDKRSTFILQVPKPERKRNLGIQRSKWVDDINMDIVERGWGCVDWIGLSEDKEKWRALVNAVMNLWVA